MAYQGLYLVYSGGSTNTNPNSSLGGAASTVIPGGFFSPQKITPYGSIPGITPCVSKGNPLGLGYLIWTAGVNTLTWIPYGDVSAYSEAGPAYSMLMTLNMPKSLYPAVRYTITINQGSGLYEIGVLPSLLVYVNFDSLSTENEITSVLIEPPLNNSFDDVAYAENQAGDTEYRCLWLKNAFADKVEQMTISVASQPTNCTIQIANEFISQSEYPLVTESEENVITDAFLRFNWDGPLFFSSDYELTDDDGSRYIGMPLAAVGMQSSDGQTGELPVLLANESDSTNLLSGLSWGTSIEFQKPFESGKMVSFWIKRVKTAGLVATQTENFSLTIAFTGG